MLRLNLLNQRKQLNRGGLKRKAGFHLDGLLGLLFSLVFNGDLFFFSSPALMKFYFLFVCVSERSAYLS